jgi:hypothetical protein
MSLPQDTCTCCPKAVLPDVSTSHSLASLGFCSNVTFLGSFCPSVGGILRQSRYVAQAGLELVIPPASVFQVLGLQECTHLSASYSEFHLATEFLPLPNMLL